MKRPVLLLAFASVVLFLFLVQPAHAFYQWVDDHGVLHVTDYPPPSKETPAEEPEKAPQPAAPSTAEAPKAAPMTAPAISAPHVAAPATMQTRTGVAVATRQSAAAAVPASTKPSPAAVPPVPSPMPTPAPEPQAAAPSMQPRSHAPLSSEAMAMFAGGVLLPAILIGVAVYFYFSLSMYLIAKKLNVDVAWMSWVPILQLWPFISSAGKPCWWVLLFFIPIVGFIIYIYLWMLICERLGRNKWLGLLILVPVVNMVLPGLLAFSKADA